MRVRIQHTTRLDYSVDVTEAVTDARLGPYSDPDQRWERYFLRVTPAAAVRRYTDGFGNEAHLVTLSRPHRFLEIVSGGEVTTELVDPFQPPPTPPGPLTPGELADYLTRSALVRWDDDVRALAMPYAPKSATETFEAARRMMEHVYNAFTYQPNVTNVATTVLEVMSCKAGVCQDFAHVMLAMCRSIGIPARYVSGYIVGSAAAADARTPRRGHGGSHAWVEAFTPTHGWRGFDPTNNLVASEMHVKIGVGRDYRDVPPTRGTFRGVAEERLAVDVIAQPLT